MFDPHGDGRISKKELTESLENLRIFISDSDLADIISKIDVNGDGFVDIDEFKVLYLLILEGRNDEEDMREVFNVFDRNGDGFITVDEIRSVFDSLGMNGRTAEECKTMITKVDVDGDGMVDYKEFRKMMKGGEFGSLTTNDT